MVFGDHGAAVARLRAALADAAPGGLPLRRVRRAVLAVQNPGGRPEREVLRARLVAETSTVRARFYRLLEGFEDAVVEALVDGKGADEETQDWARVVAAELPGPEPGG